jgi:hypothetical protein
VEKQEIHRIRLKTKKLFSRKFFYGFPRIFSLIEFDSFDIKLKPNGRKVNEQEMLHKRKKEENLLEEN